MGIINNDTYVNPYTGENITGTYFHIGTNNPLHFQKTGADQYRIMVSFMVHYNLDASNNNYPSIGRENIMLTVTEADISSTSMYTLAYNHLKTVYTNFVDA
jgi:hypothetical protein